MNYFSATGSTRGVAEKIATVTGADIYEIVPAKAYTAEDLEYYGIVKVLAAEGGRTSRGSIKNM